jgi:hypothetical protein
MRKLNNMVIKISFIITLAFAMFTTKCAVKAAKDTSAGSTGTKPGITYSGSAYTFYQNSAISKTPTLTGDAAGPGIVLTG